ncbi:MULTISPECIES: diaminopimelate epimerase [unclassified Pseudomonas]|uniref:diaminopimelate epimerase n=1 Tax=unclassified Pseudomonas TaxID=196821 RepID=UPI002AC8A187|nr:MULTISPECIES: diaminopimelate epimerase [unclassified Pseudomonas]MEB0047023.1 diaminopimelate epimerase [Pseudomonas sp. Dout3]MEB0097825.1 diaminopimelate epimerase [Pseudomonas sp. DC1.2]WPX57216.1 diaminopimelate epimerase [Pseudomonas sp. DC1.2]
MTAFYDARGNIYAVVTPEALRAGGFDVPEQASQAALRRETWALAAVTACCGWTPGARPPGSKDHRCDGLLVGPFQAATPFDLLIVNTDGTLAERSGNGLTIFSQALSEQGLLPSAQTSVLRVHHDKRDAVSPVETSVKTAEVEGVSGFWLDLGKPLFGPQAVGASGVEHVMCNGRETSHLPLLSALARAWNQSQFVRIGNPHCVTLLTDADALPSNEQMLEPGLFEGLMRIAYAPPSGAGRPCAAGVNLQWAMLDAEGRIVARVFERGEGPTASSGTSASAVACAAWRMGWVSAGAVSVVMPGGTAPILLEEELGELSRVRLFGTARLID